MEESEYLKAGFGYYFESRQLKIRLKVGVVALIYAFNSELTAINIFNSVSEVKTIYGNKPTIAGIFKGVYTVECLFSDASSFIAVNITTPDSRIK